MICSYKQLSENLAIFFREINFVNTKFTAQLPADQRTPIHRKRKKTRIYLDICNPWTTLQSPFTWVICKEPSFRLKMTLKNIPPSIFATPPFILQVNLLLFLAGSMSIALHQCPCTLPMLAFYSLQIVLKKSCYRQKAAPPLCSLVHGERAQGWQTANSSVTPRCGLVSQDSMIYSQKSNFFFCVTYSNSSAREKETSATLPADWSSLWKHWQIIVRIHFPEAFHFFFLSVEIKFM